MNRQRLKSIMELANTEDILLLSHSTRQFGILQAQLIWKLEDFCKIHQIVYIQTEKMQNEINGVDLSSHEDDESAAISLSRRWTNIQAMSDAMHRLTPLTEQLTIVGLWTICEQYLCKILIQLDYFLNNNENEVQESWRWDQIEKGFKASCVSLKNCASFDIINECRVLNNNIRHLPTVSDKLAAFESFRKLKGRDIERVPMDVQRYYVALANFFGSLLQTCDNIVETKGKSI